MHHDKALPQRLSCYILHVDNMFASIKFANIYMALLAFEPCQYLFKMHLLEPNFAFILIFPKGRKNCNLAKGSPKNSCKKKDYPYQERFFLVRINITCGY